MKAFRLSLLATYFASALGLGAIDLQNLIDRSPFSPPQSANTNAAPPPEAATLEFRGVVTDETGVSYSVFDATANRGFWVREGDPKSQFTVKSYNAQDNLLEIEQNGKPIKLSLKRATTQSGSPVVAAVPRPGMPMPGGAPAVNPSSAADTSRLEAVAAEVRRRRALRNAAANGAQQQPPPKPAQ